MIKMNAIISLVSLISISILLSGCAGIKRQQKEMEARGTIDAGGYTWEIPAESVGGNTVRANGIPSVQAATEASNILCQKNDRVAQFYKRTENTSLFGYQEYSFNCVR